MESNVNRGNELSESYKIFFVILEQINKNVDITVANVRRAYKSVEILTDDFKRHHQEIEKAANGFKLESQPKSQ